MLRPKQVPESEGLVEIFLNKDPEKKMVKPKPNTVEEKTQRIEDNLVKNNYLPNKSMWAVDETFLDSIGIFLVLDMYSRCCLGYTLNKAPVYLEADVVVVLFDLLYQSVLKEGGEKPTLVHADDAPIYKSDTVKAFFATTGILLSKSTGKPHGNQIIESFHNTLKQRIAFLAFSQPVTKGKKEMLKTLTAAERKITNLKKSTKKEIRNKLFKTTFFQKQAPSLILQAVANYNETPHVHYTKYTKLQVDFYIRKVVQEHIPLLVCQPKTKEGYNLMANQFEMLDQVDCKLQKIKAEHPENMFKMVENLYVLAAKANQNELATDLKSLVLSGFQQTFNRFDELKTLNEELKTQNTELSEKVNFLTAEAEELRAVRERRKERSLQYAKRKKKEILNGIELTHYLQGLKLIGFEETLSKARLRVAFTLLFITGARITEVLYIDKSKVGTLFQNQRPFIAMDRLKKGPTNKKAFLTKEGGELVKDRKKDFEFLLTAGEEKSEYLFFPRNSEKPQVSREYFNRTVNSVLKELSVEFQACFTSHSFRKGYITKLWKDSGDIELVRGIIGHSCIATTKRYIETPDDFFYSQRIEELYGS